jgi:hypothetical protein
MIQCSENTRLSFEAAESFGLSGNSVRQHFDRNRAPESRIGRPIHFTHTADAE